MSEQNGVKWPQRGAGLDVFTIAQELSTTKGDFATRDEVVAAAVEKGVNESTARVNYGQWLKYWQGEPQKETKPAPTAPAVPMNPVTGATGAAIQQQIEATRPAAPVPPAPPAMNQSAPQAFTPPPMPTFTQPPAIPTPAPFATNAPAPVVEKEPEVVRSFTVTHSDIKGMEIGDTFTVAEPKEAAPDGIAENPVPDQQSVNVEVEFGLRINIKPAITKLERLLEILKEADDVASKG